MALGEKGFPFNDQGNSQENFKKPASKYEGENNESNINQKAEEVLKKLTKVMERRNWEAQEPKRITMLKAPVKKIVLTWTETDQCYSEEDCVRIVRAIQLNHIHDEGEPDIRHNFLLGGDGALYEGRGFTREGPQYSSSVDEEHALTGQSLEIAFIDKCVNQPSPTLLKVLADCLAFGVDGRIIEPKFNMYWMAERDVIYIEPRLLKCNHTCEHEHPEQK